MKKPKLQLLYNAINNCKAIKFKNKYKEELDKLQSFTITDEELNKLISSIINESITIFNSLYNSGLFTFKTNKFELYFYELKIDLSDMFINMDISKESFTNIIKLESKIKNIKSEIMYDIFVRCVIKNKINNADLIIANYPDIIKQYNQSEEILTKLSKIILNKDINNKKDELINNMFIYLFKKLYNSNHHYKIYIRLTACILKLLKPVELFRLIQDHDNYVIVHALYQMNPSYIKGIYYLLKESMNNDDILSLRRLIFDYHDDIITYILEVKNEITIEKLYNKLLLFIDLGIIKFKDEYEKYDIIFNIFKTSKVITLMDISTINKYIKRYISLLLVLNDKLPKDEITNIIKTHNKLLLKAIDIKINSFDLFNNTPVINYINTQDPKYLQHYKDMKL